MKAMAIVGLLCLAFPVVATAGDGEYRFCESCLDVDDTISPTPAWQTVAGTTAGQPNSEYSYAFCAVGGGTYTFSTCEGTSPGGATYDSALSIWTNNAGVCGASQACNDDNCPSPNFLHSEIVWVAPADGDYIIVVDGFSTSAGTFRLAYMGPECAGPTPTEDATWTSIKAVYR